MEERSPSFTSPCALPSVDKAAYLGCNECNSISTFNSVYLNIFLGSILCTFNFNHKKNTNNSQAKDDVFS